MWLDFGTPCLSRYREQSKTHKSCLSLRSSIRQQERWQLSRSYCWRLCYYARLGWSKFVWAQLSSRLQRDRCPTNRTSKTGHVSFLTALCTRDRFILASHSAVSNFSCYTIIIIIINHKKKRICKIVDFAVSEDHRINLKECAKEDKYLDLARELKKL